MRTGTSNLATKWWNLSSSGKKADDHRQNNDPQWERNESCRSDYHQTSERIQAFWGFEQGTSLVSVPARYHWLIVWCLTPFSTVFQLYRGVQCTHPCFPVVLLSSNPRNILSKPLAAFPHNCCRISGQRWERNESWRNDYHQTLERILAELSIEPATSCSQFMYATDWAMGLDPARNHLCYRGMTGPNT